MLSNGSKRGLLAFRLTVCLTFLGLIACAGPAGLLVPPTPPPAPVPIQIHVQGTPLPAESLTPVYRTFWLTLTPAYHPSTSTPLPWPTSTVTATGALAVTPASVILPPPSPTQGVTPVSARLVELVPAGTANIFNGPLTSTIQLSDPSPGYLLPAALNQLEFKWVYTINKPRPCFIENGYGFEIRIWPHPGNPYLPATHDAITPLGITDAKQAQPAIASSCDPLTGSRRYLATNLKSAPGVLQAGGHGQFFWDVAYVQLEPYYLVLAVSPSRDFFIPATGPTPTPGLTPTPTPAFPLTPQPRPGGRSILLKPDHGAVLPISIGPVQFEWRWDGPQPRPCQVAEGYGFELRIWSRQPGFTPLGVRDAVTGQNEIRCDPATGVYSTIVFDLKRAPGVAATYQGELHWTGQFWWDVALVSIRPYLPPESASEPRPFDLSLSGYAGPPDRLGRSIRCSELGTWPEAQAFFLGTGGPDHDPNKLDPDGNDLACEELIK